MIIGCPICDEPLCSAPPNYDAMENVQAQGDGVVVVGSVTLTPAAGSSKSRNATTVKGPKFEVIATHCGHMFHVACLEEWFKNCNARTCPSCRKLCPITEIVTIFPVILDQNELDISAGASAIQGGASIPVNTSGGSAGTPVAAGVGDAAYEELFTTHQTLLVDFHEKEVKLGEKIDENAMKEGIIKSYETGMANKVTEIAILKHELAAYRAGRDKDAYDVQREGKK